MLGGRSIEASEMAALVVLLMACFWLVCSMYILKYSFSSVNAFILLPSSFLFYPENWYHWRRDAFFLVGMGGEGEEMGVPKRCECVCMLFDSVVWFRYPFYVCRKSMDFFACSILLCKPRYMKMSWSYGYLGLGCRDRFYYHSLQWYRFPGLLY